MTDRILASLKRLNVEEYEIMLEKMKSSQMFFIKKSLDVKRIENTESYSVIVYKSFEKGEKKLKGNSLIHIYSGMTDEEIDTAISSALLAASFVCNPTYELQQKTENKMITMESDLNDKTLEECCDIMAEALFAEDKRNDVFLNSAELFVYEKTVRIIISNGLDVGYVKRYVSGEFVAQCKEPQDVETYKDFHYDSLDTEALKQKVRTTLDYTLSRALAQAAPKAGNYRVILSDSYVKEIFTYYKNRASAPYIFAKYSSFKIGENIQNKTADGGNGEIKGDKISLSLIATEPFSREGTPQKDRVMIEDGVLKCYHGGVRFSRYIGTEPTGEYGSMKVEAGSMSFEDMKKEPYLFIVNFSDFQMDDFSGHFGGEIRLGFLFDGKEVKPVTGGSINGSIIESQFNMKLSKEIQKDSSFEGPYAICFENIPVAGA